MSDIEKFNESYENEQECADCEIHYSDEQPAHPGKWALRDRLRSKVLWTAVVSCVITVFTALGLWDKLGITSEAFKACVVAVGAVLTVFGVLNDPTNKEGF